MNTGTSTKHQSGFGAVLIIVAVVVVIGILSFVGWEVYTRHYKSNSSTAKSQATNKVTPLKHSEGFASKPTPSANPNAGYFVVSQWNVRFKPSAGLSGLEYVIWDSGTAVFTTQQLAQLVPACDATQASGYSGIGGLTRVSTSASQPIGSPMLLSTIDGYNYYYEGVQSPCVATESNTTADSAYNSANSALSDSLKTLEAAQ
jgi:Tfp pilus assembly protein PilV